MELSKENIQLLIRETVYEVLEEQRQEKEENHLYVRMCQNVNNLLLQGKIDILDLNFEVRIQELQFYKIVFRVARNQKKESLYRHLGKVLVEDIERQKQVGQSLRWLERFYHERYVNHTWEELVNGLVV